MPGYGGCNARGCRAPRFWLTWGTPVAASSTRCRRLGASARARLTRPSPTTRFATWIVRSGALAGRRPGRGRARCPGPEPARPEGRQALALQAAEAADPRAACDDHG